MYKVRFHLAKGPNFLKWQVKHGKTVQYFEPSEVVIEMKRCRLRNHRGTAERIFSGSHKTVCAWIECEELSIRNLEGSPIEGEPIKYNPKIAPNWVDGEQNADNQRYESLYTSGRSVMRPIFQTQP